MTQLLNIVIERDISGDEIIGRLHVVEIREASWLQRQLIALRRLLGKSPVYSNVCATGISVGVEMTTEHYTQLMSICGRDGTGIERGIATLALIQTPLPNQELEDVSC